jgi:WD40 repeat protein
MTLTGHTNSVWVLALSTDNQWLYSGSGDDTIKVWRIADYTCVATLIDHTDAVTTVVLSADNRWLYSGSYDQTIKIWRLADHTVAATLPCYGTAFVTDSQWLYVGCGRHIQIRPLPMWQLWHETRHYRLSIEQAQRIVTIVLHSDDKLYYDDLRHVIRACTALWLRSP